MNKDKRSLKLKKDKFSKTYETFNERRSFPDNLVRRVDSSFFGNNLTFEQFRIRRNASQTEFVSRDEGAIIPITGFPNIQTEIENFTIEVACLAPVSRSN